MSNQYFRAGTGVRNARKNPFYAQVWDAQHSPEETYEIPMEYSAYEIAEELKARLGL